MHAAEECQQASIIEFARPECHLREWPTHLWGVWWVTRLGSAPWYGGPYGATVLLEFLSIILGSGNKQNSYFGSSIEKCPLSEVLYCSIGVKSTVEWPPCFYLLIIFIRILPLKNLGGLLLNFIMIVKFCWRRLWPRDSFHWLLKLVRFIQE